MDIQLYWLWLQRSFEAKRSMRISDEDSRGCATEKVMSCVVYYVSEPPSICTVNNSWKKWGCPMLGLGHLIGSNGLTSVTIRNLQARRLCFERCLGDGQGHTVECFAILWLSNNLDNRFTARVTMHHFLQDIVYIMNLTSNPSGLPNRWHWLKAFYEWSLIGNEHFLS